MNRALVVGLGNSLRGDDGVAHAVVQQLSSSGWAVEAIAVPQLTPEWSERIANAEVVVFVDAAKDTLPGQIRCRVLGSAEASQSGGIFTHHCPPSTVVNLASRLWGRCPPAYLVTIGGESFEIGSTLSAGVRAAIPQTLDLIRSLIEAHPPGRAPGQGADTSATGYPRIDKAPLADPPSNS
jgi:hydrogenase maturation protease